MLGKIFWRSVREIEKLKRCLIAWIVKDLENQHLINCLLFFFFVFHLFSRKSVEIHDIWMPTCYIVCFIFCRYNHHLKIWKSKTKILAQIHAMKQIFPISNFINWKKRFQMYFFKMIGILKIKSKSELNV